MDINQLNCFISVAQTLNFSEAARRNYVSQSTVSRYIGDLEKEFGVQLFTRSHRDVIISNEGKALLPYAIEIVDTLKQAKSVIKQMHNGGQGKITIGCDISSVTFPTKCIADFYKQYPNIVIDVRPFDAKEKRQDIIGEYDFCFMPRDMVTENAGVETLLTHYESLTVITTKNGKFGNNRKSISLKELSNEKILLLSESVCPIVYMEIIDLLRTFHISPEIDSSYEEISSMYVAAASGIGIPIIPHSVAEISSREYTNKLEIEDADTSIAYVMAWEKNIANPAAKLFIEAVKKYAKGEDNIYDL